MRDTISRHLYCLCGSIEEPINGKSTLGIVGVHLKSRDMFLVDGDIS